MMAFGLVLFVGLAVASIRNRVGRRWLAVLGLGALIAAGALVMSRSKGAVLASAAGLVLLLAPFAGARIKELLTRHGGAVAVVLVAATLLGVVFRGAVLPESWLGEKSLLFRWHYLVGAGRVVSDHLITGVGPDGFQAAYTAVRVPRSPEEVASAHSMFADWLAMLGVLGAAWIGLVPLLTWRGGAARDRTADETVEAPAPAASRMPLLAAAIVAVLGLLPALPFEAADVDSLGKEIGRAIGVLGYVACAAGLGLVLPRMRSSAVDRALACAAVVLVVHGQIEMTFFDPGSVTWMMCILGLAGGALVRPARSRSGIIVSIVLLVFAVVLLFTGACRLVIAQIPMGEAAGILYPPEETRDDQLRQREQAAEQLDIAYSASPSWVMPLDEAVRQLLVAATLAEGPRRLELIDSAFALAEQAMADHGKPTSIALAGEAAWFRAAETGEPDDWQRAIDLNRRLTDIDPHGIGSWLRYGDVLWESGRRDEATTAYRRVLVNDANFELDPLKQRGRHGTVGPARAASRDNVVAVLPFVVDADRIIPRVVPVVPGQVARQGRLVRRGVALIRIRTAETGEAPHERHAVEVLKRGLLVAGPLGVRRIPVRQVGSLGNADLRAGDGVG
jgi:tetratricopeptide (TPR) repeat protein